MEIYILKLNKDLPRDDFEKLLGFVSQEKKERLLRFHRYEDAQRSLLGDILARYIICNRLKVNNRDLVFSTNDFGKPILEEPRGIHFNISHSGNWVACAVDDNSVGIDIEVIKPIDFKIGERFFTGDEYLLLLNQPEELRLKYFYIVWTFKESYIKAEGKGLSIPLNSFNMKINNQDIYGLTVANSEIIKYCFYQYFLDDNTVCSICAKDMNIKTFTNFTTEKIVKEWFNLIYRNIDIK